mgnify:CR=1 FL=1
MHAAIRTGQRWLAAAAVAVLCGACAGPPAKPAEDAAPMAANAGFLSNYALLQALPDDPDYRRYVEPGTELRGYRSFIVEPPVLLLNNGGAYLAPDTARLADASQYYEQRMTRALGQHYRVVAAPGPGVARLRVAVVGLAEVKPPLKPRDFVPVAALFHVAERAAEVDPFVLRMSIEGELRDAQTGAVLGEAIDSRQGRETVRRGDAPAPAQLHDLIDFWVARLVAQLDKVNGYAH